jgi:HEAT repeat protein
MSHGSRPVGVLLTDAELRITAWDPWLARVTGLPAEAVRQRRLVDLVPDLEARGVAELLRTVLATGNVVLLAPAVHEALIPCPPPQASPYFQRMQQRVTIGPLRNGDGIEGLMILIEDVTARRERERAIAADLRHPDPAVRAWAARALTAANSLVETDALRTSWSDADWQTRRATVWRLAGRADRELVASLLLALRDHHRDFSVLSSALNLLAFCDVDIVSPLVEFLRDPDASLRIQAALALGDRPDPRSTAALRTALDDADPNVRFHAIEALGRLRAADAVDALTAIAESRDFFLAFAAIDALARIGEPRVAARLLPLLDDEALRAAVTDALGALATEAIVPELIALLERDDAPVDAVVRALRALDVRARREGDEGSVPAAVRRALRPASTQRLLDAISRAGVEPEALATVLGWLEGGAAGRALTRLLGSPAARPAVIQALVASGPYVVDALLEQLGAEDLEVRQAAVEVLGRIGDSRATLPLVAALRDGELTLPVLEALGRIGDARAFDTLMRLLGHADAPVRRAAVAACRALDDPRTPARAVALLGDADPRVREAAVRLLTPQSGDGALDALDEACRDASDLVRGVALERLAMLDPERARGRLLEALQAPSARVRAAAARGLGLLSGTAGPLVAALDDADAWVRYFAVRALARQGDDTAVAALARVAGADAARHVVMASLDGLREVGSPAATAALARVAPAAIRGAV